MVGGINMYRCLTAFENNILNNWELYSKRKQPIVSFINEMCNIVIIHHSLLESNAKHLTIQDSLSLVIESLNVYPYLIEKKTRETLDICKDELIEQINRFENWLETVVADTKWFVYVNASGSSSVLKYRIGSDYIDVVFSGSESFYYRYSYSKTGIFVTELLKRLALKGIGLGRHTRKIKAGMFEKRLIK